MTHYPDDSFALHTDLYQINMMETYFNDGIHNKKAVFDVYFRRNPFKNGYAIFAGLERVITYIKDLKFTESDIQYLREELKYDEAFLEYLKELRFTGTIRSMKEGELVFENEPLMRIEAPLAEAQLVETAILNIINYQTLIATKASRLSVVTGGESLFEFGTRRAQETEAAIWGTRAAYIGGFQASSNVRAGKKFGIPVVGTHAHALVQAYRDEYTAFRKYAESHYDCTFLVDTFDTLKSGVPTAIRVAKEMGDKINFKAIRLDSGDLAYLSKKARKMLDEAGFTDTLITASNDLDEATILNLKAQGAKIDMWGVGTKLITAYDQPALGAVYKMVSIEDENGDMVDTIKISANPEKVTTPGMKNVYRIINKETNKSEGDYITLEYENPASEEILTMFHPVHTFISKEVTNFDAVPLHENIFVDGQLVYKTPALTVIQQFAKDNLDLLWDEYKRFLNPEKYPVDLSPKCWENKRVRIQEIMEHVRKTEAEVKNWR